jgi:adenosylcobinamide-GDP ribazoletransferase
VGDLLLALQFLTVLPVRSRRAASEGPPAMAGTLPWFPVVGGLIGALLAVLDWVLAHWLALGVRDAVILAVAALATGMLHLDGFVDCCDALLGARTPERRLEILRDSRVGAYGALGAALLAIALFAALGALPAGWRAFALVTAPALGRWGMVLAVALFRYARSQGAGSPFRARPRHLVLASLALVVVLALASLLAPVPFARAAIAALVVILLALFVATSWSAWAARRLGGGLTGDTYGALNELVELAVLIAVPVVASHL